MTNKIESVLYRACFLMRYLVFRNKFVAKLSVNSMIAPSADLRISNNAKVNCGKSFCLLKHSSLIAGKHSMISIGDNVTIGIGNFINIHDGLEIGNNVLLGQDVKIYDHDHDIKNYTIEGMKWRNNFSSSPVTVGNNVWIGSNVIILRGTKIGDNCVIAAGSILKGIYPPNSIVIQKRIESIMPVETKTIN